MSGFQLPWQVRLVAAEEHSFALLPAPSPSLLGVLTKDALPLVKGDDPPCSEEGRKVHPPCARISACSPEQTCPPTPPKILRPVPGVAFTQFVQNTGRDEGLSWCQRVSVARRSGLGFGEEEGVLPRGDQGPGFPFSAQVLPWCFITWRTNGE